jgi:hypothetical protein
MSHKKMTERELCALIAEAEGNSVINSGDMLTDNEKYLQYYNAELFGDEVEGQSAVISTDVRDLVEADTASLARVFLGAGDPVEFRAMTGDPESVQEAKDKQKLVSHIIKTAKDSYRTRMGWLKSSEYQSVGAIEYGVEEVKTPRFKRYKGLTEQEMAVLFTEIESDPTVDKVEVAEQDEEEGGKFSILARITSIRQNYFMRNIPFEDLIISRNAETKDDAEIIGKRFTKTRSQLIAEGFSHDVVDGLPASNTNTDSTGSTLRGTRYRQQGGSDDTSINDWANQQVTGEDVYMLVDFDGDGIAERRHIIKIGNEIIENEPFDHVPYAFISSMLSPNSLIGVPRAELAMEYQRVNSFLRRGIVNNIAAVNHPRTAYTEGIVDLDDLMDIRLDGLISVEGVPQQSLMPITTEYIGDRALQVVQFMEGQKAQSTGVLQANQALQADNLHKETATRFNGMEDAATALIETVARNIAETGMRDLWEGIAWFAAHYQDEDLEFRVFGRQMVVSPTSWKHDHYVAACVGTGAGDDAKILQNLNAQLQMQVAFQQAGSPLVDIQKQYNTLAEMTRIMGRDAVEQFWNNPEMPEQMITAERDMLKAQVKQMGELLSQTNQLAEAEQVKGQLEIQKEVMKQKFQGQMEILKLQNASQQEIQELTVKHQSELNELQFKYDQLEVNTKLELTKLAVAEGNDTNEVLAAQDSNIDTGVDK